MVAQAGLVSMGLIDIWCAARSTTQNLAAVGLGTALSVLWMGAAVGVAMGVEPLTAQAYGAGEYLNTRIWRSQAMWVASLVGIPATLMVVLTAAAVPWVGLAPGFSHETQLYLLGRAPSVLFAGWYTVYRGYQSSLGRTKPAFYAVVVANVANFFLNNIFLFDLNWGAFGVGFTTTLTNLLMFWICYGYETSTRSFISPCKISICRLLHLGWPIAGHNMAEIGIFSLVSALISLEGATVLAGHQIAVNCSSLIFMAAVGLSVGASARVGYHIGGGRIHHARRVGLITNGVGVLFMATGASCLLAFSTSIAQFFAPHAAAVQRQAALFLHLAAVFSIPDGIQAVCSGALRGAGHTRIIFLANVFSHVVLGLPIGLGLAIGLGWKSVGYWWGLTAGLTSVAILLSLRLWKVTRPGHSF